MVGGMVGPNGGMGGGMGGGPNPAQMDVKQLALRTRRAPANPCFCLSSLPGHAICHALLMTTTLISMTIGI